MKKERWFNYRPLCLVFAFLLLGSVFVFYCFYDKSNSTNKYLPMIFSLLSLVIVIAILIFFTVRNKNIKFLLVPLISFIVGAGLFSCCITNFNNSDFTNPSTITARIYSVSEHGAVQTVYAKDIYFNGIKTRGKICVRIYDSSYQFDDIEIGRLIKFSPTEISATDLLDGDIPREYYFSQNIKYFATTNIKDVTIGDIKLSLADKIKQKIKNSISNGLTNENTELVYSALFGDKSMLSDTSKSAFKLAGVSHLLAVSGLHVGIIVSILCWIFKKLKCPNWLQLLLTSVILVFYIYLCDFSASIVRASIMTVVLMLAPMLHRRYDSLSAIGMAGIICFVINPLFAFSVGGVMSFLCVLSISLFSSSINNVLIKTKLPKSICSSLAISSSTLISLMMVMAYYYQTFNLISLLANIILIPLFTVGFIIVFIIGFLGLIVSKIGILLMPVNYLFDCIVLIANILGNLSFANFTTISVSYISMIVYLILLIIMSRFTTARNQHKLIVILPLVAILFAVML